MREIIMAYATALTLPSPGLRETLFPNKSAEPYSPKGPENIKVTTTSMYGAESPKKQQQQQQQQQQKKNSQVSPEAHNYFP